MKVEYKVRHISRAIVTRYEESENGSSVSTLGEYSNNDLAFEVAYGLCRSEHERLGYPLDDERIIYPKHPSEVQALAD